MNGNAHAARQQAQRRVNRMLLAGTLGGLALFFSIIIAQSTSSDQSLAPQTSQSVEQQSQPLQPRVRTRTS